VLGVLDAHATVLLAVDLDEPLVGIEQEVVGLVSDRVDGEVQPRPVTGATDENRKNTTT
jgi:hypothetical protein